MKLMESSEERNRFGNAGRVVESILIALAVIAVVAAGSIFMVCRLVPFAPDPLELLTGWDGYYKIYTAADYKKFWEIARDKPEAKGRLMADIYLNNVSDYDHWKSSPPKSKIEKVDNFYGVFDGNGHTIYGLYSIYGYGIVKENGGEIYDLSIRKSYIRGDSTVGGFCQVNISTISGCVFGGKLASTKKDITNYDNMAGICALNSGKIEKCGFEGSMDITPGWRTKGFRAGICSRNRYVGDINQCYNISYLETRAGAPYCYAIADNWEKNCFSRKDSAWNLSRDGQVTLIDAEQIICLPALMEGDLYGLYWQRQHLPEYCRQLTRLKQELAGDETVKAQSGILWDLKPEAEPGQERKDQIVREVLEDEKINALAGAIMEFKEESWHELEIEAVETAENNQSLLKNGYLAEAGRLPAAIWISDGEEKIKLACYPRGSYGDGTDEEGMDYEQLWKICGNILEQEDYFEHYTWQVCYDAESEKETGVMVLYQDREEKLGFFFITGNKIIQAQSGSSAQRGGISDVKNQVRDMAGQREEDESKGNNKERDESAKAIEEAAGNKLWERAFYGLWQDGLPGDIFTWKDDVIRKGVYSECYSYDSDVPPIEDMVGLESLLVRSSDSIRTFEDLEKLPHLSSLTVESTGGDVCFDLTAGIVPELRTLFIDSVLMPSAEFLEELPELTTLGMVYCGLEDISFLRKLPHLKEISFFGNALSDISPIVNCKELEILSLAKNGLSDISPLASLPELKELGLQRNEIEDLAPLEGLENLERLNLSSNQVRDISPLSNLRNLTALGLEGNEVRDITALEKMEKMVNLSLDANMIQDIGPLKNMSEMEFLGLSSNHIRDYTSIKGMEKLFALNVGGNPGQDIGKLVFVPWLTFGSQFEEAGTAQEYLELYYPGRKIKAEDIVLGDLDGDGVNDMAITGLVDWSEDSVWSGERYVYPFIAKGDGSFTPLAPIKTLGPGAGGVYGDPYQGIIITERMLVIQVYGGSNWRWGSTGIYEYEYGQMQEKWEVGIGHFVYNSGMDLTILDVEKNHWKTYVAAGEWERHMELLLTAEENGEPNVLKEEADKKIAQFIEETGTALPEAGTDIATPRLDGWYDYYILDYPVKKEPSWVLERAAEKFLEDARALPVFCYTSEEIKESYEKLTGVDLPEEFYIGFQDGVPAVLYYSGCQEEDGVCVHELDVRKPDEEGEYWNWDHPIYFYEDTGSFEENAGR